MTIYCHKLSCLLLVVEHIITYRLIYNVGTLRYLSYLCSIHLSPFGLAPGLDPFPLGPSTWLRHVERRQPTASRSVVLLAPITVAPLAYITHSLSARGGLTVH